MREININEIENVKIGSAEDMTARTGCTVIICERGAPTGVDVRGGGPASRETELLSQQATCDRIHAVLLSGGSAYGLDAAGGVMEYLESKGVGLPVGKAVVPLVCQSCIFDLLVGKNVRPDKAMAKKACEAAEENRPAGGRVGAGAGATVGKLLGPDFAMDSGLGIYALQLGELKVGAVVAVNACGDVYDFESGEIIAGLLNDDKTGFRDSEATLYKMAEAALPPGNTTIGVVITNAKLDKSRMTKVAQMAQDGYARSLRPVHTTMDGDTVYAMSVGGVESDVDLVGTLAARVMAGAIRNAVKNNR